MNFSKEAATPLVIDHIRQNDPECKDSPTKIMKDLGRRGVHIKRDIIRLIMQEHFPGGFESRRRNSKFKKKGESSSALPLPLTQSEQVDAADLGFYHHLGDPSSGLEQHHHHYATPGPSTGPGTLDNTSASDDHAHHQDDPHGVQEETARAIIMNMAFQAQLAATSAALGHPTTSTNARDHQGDVGNAETAGEGVDAADATDMHDSEHVDMNILLRREAQEAMRHVATYEQDHHHRSTATSPRSSADPPVEHLEHDHNHHLEHEQDTPIEQSDDRPTGELEIQGYPTGYMSLRDDDIQVDVGLDREPPHSLHHHHHNPSTEYVYDTTSVAYTNRHDDTHPDAKLDDPDPTDLVD